MNRPRVPFIFCIGFNKCGTTSLYHFFQNNGVPSVHNAQGRLALGMFANLLNGKRVFAGFDQRFRCYSDMVFVNDRIALEGNWHYRTMDRDYPDSFFIYNTRDMEKWLKSKAKWVGPAGSYMARYKKILQTDKDEDVIAHWRDKRLAFEAEMRRYFAGRKNLLEVDIEDPDCPRTISSFLGLALDPAKWVWANKSQPQESLTGVE